MSMYNLLHGVNPFAPILLKILDVDTIKKIPDIDTDNEEKTKKYVKECIDKKIYTSGRFRDIFLNEEGTKITLYTRNGGGNRETYWYIFDILKTHPNFVKEFNDDFDCTYAYVEFTVPVQYLAYTRILAKKSGKPETVHEKFQKVIQEIQDMPQEKLENDPVRQEIPPRQMLLGYIPAGVGRG